VPSTRWETIKFHPNGTLYAISDGPTTIAQEGLYRRNPDQSWFCLGPVQGPYYESEFEGLTFSRIDPNLIVMGGNDFGGGWGATVWFTTDGGQTWEKRYEGAKASQHVSDLEIAADGTDQLILGSVEDYGEEPRWAGTLRSSDGGTTWLPANAGMGVNQGYALEPIPGEPFSFWFAGNWFNGGLWKTTDGGLSWANPGPHASPIDVKVDRVDKQVIYVIADLGSHIERSTDGGAVFTWFNEGLSGAGFLQSLDYVAGRLLLATSTGVYVRYIPRAGDLNCDGAIDFRDINPFVQILANPAGWQSRYPNCPVENGDTNQDGAVDFKDINPFVAILSGS
jgi:hypothetical protein